MASEVAISEDVANLPITELRQRMALKCGAAVANAAQPAILTAQIFLDDGVQYVALGAFLVAKHLKGTPLPPPDCDPQKNLGLDGAQKVRRPLSRA